MGDAMQMGGRRAVYEANVDAKDRVNAKDKVDADVRWKYVRCKCEETMWKQRMERSVRGEN